MDAPQQDLRLKIRLNDQFSDAEKNQLLELLNARKKYGLVWEDKPEDVEQIMQQQLPVFVEVPDLYIEAKKAILTNIPQLPVDLTDAFIIHNDLALHKEPPHHLLIEGDNLHALTALAFAMPEKVDVIYIDPPYNTGNKDFIYNDSFVDREDGYRHSKWLSFMAKRLHIAKKLLKDTGVIFISIDDNEQAQLKMLCDEVFGEANFIQDLIWHNKYTVSNDAKFFSKQHDYVLAYAKNITKIEINLLERTEASNLRYKNPDNDARGVWKATPLDARSGTQAGIYDIEFDNGIKWKPTEGRFPVYSKAKVLELYKDNRLWFGKGKNLKPSKKTFLTDVKQGMKCGSILNYDLFGHTHKANDQLSDVLGKGSFSSPKPIDLIQKLIHLSNKNKDTPSVILDFFAGSGTTLHAVMQLNAEDGGNRQCILVTNNENNIAREVCYERNKRVISGYTKPNGTIAKGLTNNHLHYLKVDFAERSSSLTAQLDLVRKATDLLRLKENCWETVEIAEKMPLRGTKQEGGQNMCLFKNATHYLLVIYDDRYLSEAVDLIGNLHPLSESVTKEYVLTYVFSDSPHNQSEKFGDMLPKVHLCALPEAIYNALRDLLPK